MLRLELDNPKYDRIRLRIRAALGLEQN